MIVIDEASVGQTLELPLGQVMELHLRENPTTGYQWQFTQSGGPSCRISDAPVAAQPPQPAPMAGAGRVHAWRIEGVAAGVCSIEMRYVRPWELNPAPAMTFGIRIKVNG